MPEEVAVEGLGFLGLRIVDPAASRETVGFFRDVLRLPVTADEGARSVRFRLADGTGVHVDGPADEDHGFYGDGPCVGLRVADVDAAQATLEAAGIRFRRETERDAGEAWAHFENPDGRAWELIGPEWTSGRPGGGGRCRREATRPTGRDQGARVCRRAAPRRRTSVATTAAPNMIAATARQISCSALRPPITVGSRHVEATRPRPNAQSPIPIA